MKEEKLKQEDPVFKFLITFKALVESGQAILLDRKESVYDRENKTNFGYEDEYYYYLRGEIVVRDVKRFYLNQGVAFPFNRNTFYDMLFERKVLEPTKNGRNSHSLKIGGKNHRFIKLNKTRVDQILETDKCDDEL